MFCFSFVSTEGIRLRPRIRTGEEKSLIDLVDTVDFVFTQYTWIGVFRTVELFSFHDLSIPLFPNSKTTATKVEVRVHLLHAESWLACYSGLIGRPCLSFHPLPWFASLLLCIPFS